MSTDVNEVRHLERLLAGLLHYGTWLASTVTAAGTVLMLAEQHGSVRTPASGTGVVTAGIALFILLPVARVLVMLGFFLRARDYRLAAIAGFVFAIILLGCALGMFFSSGGDGLH